MIQTGREQEDRQDSKWEGQIDQIESLIQSEKQTGEQGQKDMEQSCEVASVPLPVPSACVAETPVEGTLGDR